MMDPAYESMLERYRLEWEGGLFDRIIPAFMVCAAADLPLPKWLSAAVRDELEFSYQHRKRGGVMARTGAVQDASNRMHAIRHQMLRFELDCQGEEIEHGARKRLNKTEAAKKIERFLADHESIHRGSWDSILESYDRVERGGGKI